MKIYFSGSCGDQADQRARQRTFPASGFADKRQRLSLMDRQVNAGYGVYHLPFSRGEFLADILRAQQDLI